MYTTKNSGTSHIRGIKKDRVGNTIILSGTHAGAWEVTKIVTSKQFITISFPNRKLATIEFNKLTRKYY
jgi:hypothetical protein